MKVRSGQDEGREVTYRERKNFKISVVKLTDFILLVAALQLIDELEPGKNVTTRVFLDAIFENADHVMS